MWVREAVVWRTVRLLGIELDLNAAARGVFDGLFVPVAEMVRLQAVLGRSQRGEMGARAYGIAYGWHHVYAP